MGSGWSDARKPCQRFSRHQKLPVMPPSQAGWAGWAGWAEGRRLSLRQLGPQNFLSSAVSMTSTRTVWKPRWTSVNHHWSNTGHWPFHDLSVTFPNACRIFWSSAGYLSQIPCHNPADSTQIQPSRASLVAKFTDQRFPQWQLRWCLSQPRTSGSSTACLMHPSAYARMTSCGLSSKRIDSVKGKEMKRTYLKITHLLKKFHIIQLSGSFLEAVWKFITIFYQVSFRHLQDSLTAGRMATEPLQGAFLHHGVVVFDLQQLPRCLGKK